MKKLILFLTLIPTFLFGQIACPDIVCINQQTTYSVINTVGSSYTWSLTGGGLFTPTTTNAVLVTWGSVTGVYTLTVTETASGGCVGQPRTCLITIQQPVADINPIGPFCEGEPSTPVVVTPTGGVITLNGVTITQFSPTTTGNYNINYSYTDSEGCIATSTENVVVNPSPLNLPITHD